MKGLAISLNKNAIISSVEPDSPAEVAGLRKDQKIVQVNGKNVKNKTYKDIAKAIKEHENDLIIGVIDLAPQRDIPVEETPASSSHIEEVVSQKEKIVSGMKLFIKIIIYLILNFSKLINYLNIFIFEK